MNKAKLVKQSFISLILIIVFAIFKVVILNHDSTVGDRLTKLQAQAAEINDMNLALEQQIASVSSIAAIVDLADDYGFVRTGEIVYISSSQRIAYRNTAAD